MKAHFFLNIGLLMCLMTSCASDKNTSISGPLHATFYTPAYQAVYYNPPYYDQYFEPRYDVFKYNGYNSYYGTWEKN